MVWQKRVKNDRIQARDAVIEQRAMVKKFKQERAKTQAIAEVAALKETQTNAVSAKLPQAERAKKAAREMETARLDAEHLEKLVERMTAPKKKPTPKRKARTQQDYDRSGGTRPVADSDEEGADSDDEQAKPMDDEWVGKAKKKTLAKANKLTVEKKTIMPASFLAAAKRLEERSFGEAATSVISSSTSSLSGAVSTPSGRGQKRSQPSTSTTPTPTKKAPATPTTEKKRRVANGDGANGTHTDDVTTTPARSGKGSGKGESKTPKATNGAATPKSKKGSKSATSTPSTESSSSSGVISGVALGLEPKHHASWSIRASDAKTDTVAAKRAGPELTSAMTAERIKRKALFAAKKAAKAAKATAESDNLTPMTPSDETPAVPARPHDGSGAAKKKKADRDAGAKEAAAARARARLVEDLTALPAAKVIVKPKNKKQLAKEKKVARSAKRKRVKGIKDGEIDPITGAATT